MSWYGSRVNRDLTRWQSAGWVSDAGAAAIRAELAARRSPVGPAGVLAILGAVLFGFAAMSFVAANWNEMSKLARLALLLAALWAAYGGAAYLFARNLVGFANAAVLAGIAVYGGSIMLIAQMYHMEGNPPDALLAWALGALVAAVLARSPAALGAAFVLLAVWTGMERVVNEWAHWPFLPAWAATAAAALWLAWRPGLHLAALSLASWVIPLGYVIGNRHAHWIVAAAGVAAALVAVAAGPAIDRQVRSADGASQAIFAYAVGVAYAALFIWQFLDDGSIALGTALSVEQYSALAGLTLLGLVGAMAWALKTDNRAALWVAYVAFAVDIVALYIRMLGTLINTSLFFLSAAVIVTGLAWLAYRLHQRHTPATGDAT
jgi:uncharacterized membrane protein